MPRTKGSARKAPTEHAPPAEAAAEQASIGNAPPAPPAGATQAGNPPEGGTGTARKTESQTAAAAKQAKRGLAQWNKVEIWVRARAQ